MHPAKERALRVVDDAPEHRVAQHQRRRRPALVHEPLLAGEEIVQRQALPGVDGHHLPYGEPRGALGFEPPPLDRRHDTGRGPQVRFEYRRPVHSMMKHRPGGREQHRNERVLEVAHETQPRVAESLEGEVFQLRDERKVELVDGMRPAFAGRTRAGRGDLGAVPVEGQWPGGSGEAHFDAVEDGVRLTYRFDVVALEEAPVRGEEAGEGGRRRGGDLEIARAGGVRCAVMVEAGDVRIGVRGGDRPAMRRHLPAHRRGEVRPPLEVEREPGGSEVGTTALRPGRLVGQSQEGQVA